MFTNLISRQRTPAHRGDSTMKFGPRRGEFFNAAERMFEEGWPLDEATVEQCEVFDLVYRTLCAVLYNYVPLSGHPGGSISSGRFVARLLFDTMDYDLAQPNRQDADIISYAAGHKALGLYAMWALRDEVARIAAPDLLPRDEKFQLRLEDLLGFRRNPTTTTPLFRKFHAKPLDGHPTPATPFLRLSTGASGVGVPASFGLAWATGDLYREDPPRVHIIEGEGGMTPGRVAEAFAAAATASLDNIVLHIDWNQASIDSNHVCRDDEAPGEYVQWTPAELAYLHDWNVVYVPDGFDWQQITTAQRVAFDFQNGQPTAIVYRTVKGWQYGIEGRASHGAGHGLCSSAFFAAVAPLLPKDLVPLPCCEADKQRCRGGADATVVEECYWKTLSIIRHSMEASRPMVEALAAQLRAAQERLNARTRKPSGGRPHLHLAYTIAERASDAATPSDLRLKPGTKTTLREQLGRVLNYYNVATDGGFIVAAADLLGSTSINKANDKFPGGFYNRRSNPGAREIAIGGICEDAMMAMLSGISAFGAHIGAGSSYGAMLLRVAVDCAAGVQEYKTGPNVPKTTAQEMHTIRQSLPSQRSLRRRELLQMKTQLMQPEEIVELVPEILNLKKILVPIDFSPMSKRAFQCALRFAERFGCKVVLLHVIEPEMSIAGTPLAVDIFAQPEEDTSAAKAELASLAASVGKHANTFTSAVRIGHAPNEITKAAKELDVDLIMIATHGYTSWRHLCIGSTAERVVRAAPCPVLVVREKEHEFV